MLLEVCKKGNVLRKNFLSICSVASGTFRDSQQKICKLLQIEGQAQGLDRSEQHCCPATRILEVLRGSASDLVGGAAAEDDDDTAKETATKEIGMSWPQWPSLQRQRSGCRRSPVRTLPYRRMRLHAGGALVVWPGSWDAVPEQSWLLKLRRTLFIQVVILIIVHCQGPLFIVVIVRCYCKPFNALFIVVIVYCYISYCSCCHNIVIVCIVHCYCSSLCTVIVVLCSLCTKHWLLLWLFIVHCYSLYSILTLFIIFIVIIVRCCLWYWYIYHCYCSLIFGSLCIVIHTMLNLFFYCKGLTHGSSHSK